MKKVSSEAIDKLLPQTQCELCEYAGCKPYAQAISEGEAEINKCLPGGVRVLRQLGALLEKDVNGFIDEMRIKQKAPSVAVIDEQLCIGCVKCITACPVDAIVGSGKKMHTVITQDCTGCELCIAPCPMDCISMLCIDKPASEIEWENFANQARNNYLRKNERMAGRHLKNREKHKAQVKLSMSSDEMEKRAKQDYIKAALERVKKRRQE